VDPQEAPASEERLQLSQRPHVHEPLGATGADVGVVGDRFEEEDVIGIDRPPHPGLKAEQDAPHLFGHGSILAPRYGFFL